ncbi:MAG: hypothetical protein KH230_09715 [Enterocloster asparagiformis]|nr:hypothetical protein [Enterocloster asparagiformis]
METKMYIPINTPDSEDYVSGIGAFEVGAISIGTLAAIILCIAYYTLTENVIETVLIGAVIIAVTIIIFRRNQYNENLIKQLRVIIHYIKAQKRYIYEYYDMYKDISEDELDEE